MWLFSRFSRGVVFISGGGGGGGRGSCILEEFLVWCGEGGDGSEGDGLWFRLCLSEKDGSRRRFDKDLSISFLVFSFSSFSFWEDKEDEDEASFSWAALIFSSMLVGRAIDIGEVGEVGEVGDLGLGGRGAGLVFVDRADFTLCGETLRGFLRRK